MCQGGSGPSMIPTLPDEGSVTIASRLHRYGRNVKVGDIVWAQSPYFQHANVCKRVIGMPGDYVVLDKDCSPYIGGAPILDKPSGGDETGRDEPVMIEVPEGHVWLAGDNLPYSRDSRKYGPMPMGLINGKIIAAGHGWLNFGSWQWFGDRDQLVSQEVIENRGLVKTARAARYKEKE